MTTAWTVIGFLSPYRFHKALRLHTPIASLGVSFKNPLAPRLLKESIICSTVIFTPDHTSMKDGACRMINGAFTFITVIYFLTSCENRLIKPEVRPAVRAAIDSAKSTVEHDPDVEPMRQSLDSVLQRHAPLSPAEKLLEYDYYQWYYLAHRWGDYENANIIVDSALMLFEDIHFRGRHWEDYQNWILLKGDILVDLKKLDEAFTYYYQAKSNYHDNWDACKLSRFTARLGSVRYRQHNYRDAVQLYLQAYDEYRQCVKTATLDTYYEAVTEPQALLNGIAWFYDLMGMPDSAFHYYHRALAFLAHESQRFPGSQKATVIAKGVIYGNLGGLLVKTGQYTEAERYLKESVAINGQHGYDNRDAQTAQIKLVDLYIKSDQRSAAKHQLETSRKSLDALPSEDFELRWRRVNWQFHDKWGNPADAYTAFRHYHTFKDSLERANQPMMSADFTRKFESMEQQLAYTELAYKNRLQYILLLISVVALIFVLAIVYLIYSNWKRSKGHIVHLNNLNDRIHDKNEKLQLALLALQDSQQDNTRILAMVAHDLRTPVANIKMSMDYLLRQHDTHSYEETTYFEIIRKSTNQALGLIEELMHSYESNALNEGDEINLETMLHDCVEIMQMRANKKEQTLLLATEPVTLKGSREKIWRVISNLIDNAIKFTPRKGRIVVGLRREDGEAVIQVHDNGIGIDPKFHARFFEMGKSASRKGTDGEPSTGLGLAIVKQIVSAHHGTIYFTSTPETGTTFYVRLPI